MLEEEFIKKSDLDKEKEFIKKINVDKAMKKTVAALILIILSILTYVLPLLDGFFDFGLIFEGASLVFLLMARNYMSKYDEFRAKRYILCSIATIGWILIYDTIIFISTIENIVDLVVIVYSYILIEIRTLLYVAVLFAINRDLNKINNFDRYKESTDWFYERYEEKNDKNKKII